jgi:hypothetical protein
MLGATLMYACLCCPSWAGGASNVWHLPDVCMQMLIKTGRTSIRCLALQCRANASGVCCRRYYQPPSAYDRNVAGLTGTQGKPLWMVLTLLLTIVGSSLAVGFSWATHRHWALYAVGGGESP